MRNAGKGRLVSDRVDDMVASLGRVPPSRGVID